MVVFKRRSPLPLAAALSFGFSLSLGPVRVAAGDDPYEQDGQARLRLGVDLECDGKPRQRCP